MSTTKAEIKAGLTLVGKYKGELHTCEVVERDERLHFVRPDGQCLHKSLSLPGKAITGTATNGYRFWSVPDTGPEMASRARQKSARLKWLQPRRSTTTATTSNRGGRRRRGGEGPRSSSSARLQSLDTSWGLSPSPATRALLSC